MSWGASCWVGRRLPCILTAFDNRAIHKTTRQDVSNRLSPSIIQLRPAMTDHERHTLHGTTALVVLLWDVVLRQVDSLSKMTDSTSFDGVEPGRTQIPTFSSKCTLVNLLIFLAPVRFFFFPEALTAVFCAVSRGSTLWPTVDEQET